jgi:hypothetical protein
MVAPAISFLSNKEFVKTVDMEAIMIRFTEAHKRNKNMVKWVAPLYFLNFMEKYNLHEC